MIGFFMDTFCCFRTNFYQSTRDHRGRDAPLGVAYLQVFSLSPLKLRGESTSRTNTKRFRPTETVKRHPTGITQCLVHLGLPTGATSRLHFPFRHLLPKKIPLRAVTVGPFFFALTEPHRGPASENGNLQDGGRETSCQLSSDNYPALIGRPGCQ